MSVESRRRPNTNVSRLKALSAAKTKNDLLGAGSFLTTNTQNRLNAITADYGVKYHAIGLAKNALAVATVEKTETLTALRTLVSHFIQVFNLGVVRQVFNATDRTFYHIDVSSAAVPPIANEADLALVANNLVTGDPDRITAGGVPMAMPPITEVANALTNYNKAAETHTTATDAYDAALEAQDALNPEADKVIKKVWDEVETYYNEESPESQRQNAREWGVIYERKGSEKTITGMVTDQATNAPLAGATVKLEDGTNTATTGADGKYELTTVLMGEQIITARLANYADYASEITLTEDENNVWNITLVRIN